jgi:hypothetical protein
MATMSETTQRQKATEPTPSDWVAGVQVDHRDWVGHVIVCGVQPVVVQTVEQLLAAVS